MDDIIARLIDRQSTLVRRRRFQQVEQSGRGLMIRAARGPGISGLIDFWMSRCGSSKAMGAL